MKFTVFILAMMIGRMCVLKKFVHEDYSKVYGNTRTTKTPTGTNYFLMGNSFLGTFSSRLTGFVGGDTIFLNETGGNNYATGLWIGNCKGTPANHITIINDPALGRPMHMYGLQAQIACQEVQYLDISGRGLNHTDTAQLGIEINHGLNNGTVDSTNVYGPGFFGIDFDGRSKNCKVYNCAIYNTEIGIHWKQDPVCNDSLNYVYGRPYNFTLDSFDVEWNNIDRTEAEGMYIGNTAPDNVPYYLGHNGLDSSYQQRITFCAPGTNPGHHNIGLNLDSNWYRPMRNGWIRVAHNKLNHTGRGGIQVSNGDGHSLIEICYNHVYNSGMIGDYSQGTGINTGTYCAPYIHDNYIDTTLSEGIALYGSGITGTYSRIENNYINHSGFLNYYATGGYFIGGWHYALENPGQPFNDISTDRTSIAVASELITDDRANDSIMVKITGNVTGVNRSHVDEYNRRTGAHQWSYYNVYVQAYYQMETIGTPWFICNNKTTTGIVWPYVDGDTARGELQLANLGGFGNPVFRLPQVNPLLSINLCPDPTIPDNQIPVRNGVIKLLINKN